MSTHEYPCGALYCENKTSEGPRDEEHCLFCNGFFKTARRGYVERRCVYGDLHPLVHVYTLVDELGAKQADNHLVYFLFRSLHNAATATYGKTYGKLLGLMMHWIETVPAVPWDELDTQRPCRKCCGLKQPEDQCGSSCSIAAYYLYDLYRSGGAESLELARRILDAFGEMPGHVRKKGYLVTEEIMATDPMSCAGAAQYNRKVCHGIEISLMARFEAWRNDHEQFAQDCRKQNIRGAS